MGNIILTLGLAAVVVILALALMGIGLIITGKTKLRGGMCGRTPTTKKGEKGCSPNGCGICGKQDKDEQKEKHD